MFIFPGIPAHFICLLLRVFSTFFLQFLIHHIEQIIADYTGHPPLAIFLKQYFRQHARLGSRDRKAITEAVYTYYRCAAFAEDEEIKPIEIIAQGLDWCNSSNAFLRKILTDINKSGLLPHWPSIKQDIELSYELEREEWLQSMLRQPDLFLRIRKNKEAVIHKLTQAGIPFELHSMPALGENCLVVANGTKIDQLLDEQDYVVQDRSSQASLQIALQYVNKAIFQQKDALAWDVCSGAGGKTLLFKDIFPQVPLLATDVRESILHNLRMRVKNAGLKGVETMNINAADRHELAHKMQQKGIDFIICDVPCSGSGTWARTPEQFYFFDEAEIADFSALQFTIASNAAEKLKSGGYLCYITCSVFLQENEFVVDQLVDLCGLRKKHRQVINGIPSGADCMYIAVLQKP